MSEKFNFSQEEDQQKFNEKPKQEQNKMIDDSQEKAEKIHEKIKPKVDKLFLQSKLSDLVGDAVSAQQYRDSIHQLVQETIDQTERETLEKIRSFINAIETIDQKSFVRLEPSTDTEMQSMADILNANTIPYNRTSLQGGRLDKDTKLEQGLALIIGQIDSKSIIYTSEGFMFSIETIDVDRLFTPIKPN